jgi:hypothetical protein
MTSGSAATASRAEDRRALIELERLDGSAGASSGDSGQRAATPSRQGGSQPVTICYHQSCAYGGADTRDQAGDLRPA